MSSPLLWFGNAAKFLKDIVLFPEGTGTIKGGDPNNADIETYVSFDANAALLAAYDDGNPDLEVFVQADISGNIYTKGSKSDTAKAYSVDFTELVAGYSRHLVEFEPTGDVTIDYTLVGTSFVINNTCGASFDLVPNASETFNGLASFTVEDGESYCFIEGSTGNYTVLQKSAGAGGASVLVQSVFTQTAGTATFATTIPFDTSKPQNTEGSELITLSITPTSATNKLRFTAKFNSSVTSADVWFTIAMFQDSTADAIAVTYELTKNSNNNMNMVLIYEMTAGTTSATTFKLRGGTSSAVNWALGVATAFGDLPSSSFQIDEILVP